MERAWVLITAPPDVAKNLLSPIFAIEGVRLADLVRGQFALVVAIELPDQESLTRSADAIRQLDGVEQILVCEVIASQRVTPKGEAPWP